MNASPTWRHTQAALEDAEDAVDDVAEAFGIEDFSYRLQRALQQEGEEDARKRVRRCAGLGVAGVGHRLVQ